MFTCDEINLRKKHHIKDAKALEDYFEGHKYLYELESAELELYEKYQKNLQRQAAILQSLWTFAKKREKNNVNNKTEINN